MSILNREHDNALYSDYICCICEAFPFFPSSKRSPKTDDKTANDNSHLESVDAKAHTTLIMQCSGFSQTISRLEDFEDLKWSRLYGILSRLHMRLVVSTSFSL